MLEKAILEELQEYVDRHLLLLDLNINESLDIYYPVESDQEELDNFINKNRKQSFNQILFAFIDKKGLRDTDVYKKAAIDRRHFSKIRSNPNYRISKKTVVSLAISLELNKEETDQLLGSAGFSLSENDTFDLVIQFCIEKKIYDIDYVNQALDHYNIRPLI